MKEYIELFVLTLKGRILKRVGYPNPIHYSLDSAIRSLKKVPKKTRGRVNIASFQHSGILKPGSDYMADPE